MSGSRRHRPINVDDDEFRIDMRRAEESFGGIEEPVITENSVSASPGRRVHPCAGSSCRERIPFWIRKSFVG